MYLGVDYYPEQWDIKMMNEDLDNIVELGANVIRIGEFAWTLMEKNEGEYDFSFFDNVIEKAKERNLKVIFGTPTATMPAWVAYNYPETLSEFNNGRKRVFGGRREYCFNSLKYKELVSKIVKALGEHYKNEETIVAWQLDNEFGHEDSDQCFCPNCQKAFVEYLKEEFGDIDSLNECMGTVFWNKTFGSFEEIGAPLPTITTHNPSLRMYWERFRSKSVVDFCEFQYNLLKGILGENSIVFHDFSGGYFDKSIDFSDVSKHIDIVAFNNYPVWGGQKEPIPNYEIACGLDLMRGLKNQNFWITEAIMGAQGHDVIGYLPRPNQAVMWSAQAMARGCSSLIYFRYRGFVKGAEQFCYGILDQDNQKRRKYKEVQTFFKDIKEHKNLLDTSVNSKVAIVYDYDSMASFRIQKQSKLFDYKNEVYRMYKPFFENGVNVDVIPSWSNLDEYDVICLPSMIVMDETFASYIKELAKNGKSIVMGYRSSIKDKFNNLTLGEFNPVNCCDLIGGRIEEIEALQENQEVEISGKSIFEGITGEIGVFRDMVALTTGEPLFAYNDRFYNEYTAVSKNVFGEGCAYYIGGALDDTTMELIMKDVLISQGIEFDKLPDNLEIVNREGAIIFINHGVDDIVYNGVKLGAYEYKIEYIGGKNGNI